MTKENLESLNLLKQTRLLIPRLEKLTPDSSWAHKASGCRRSLLRLANILEENLALQSSQGRSLEYGKDVRSLEKALKEGFRILEAAAKEKMEGW